MAKTNDFLDKAEPLTSDAETAKLPKFTKVQLGQSKKYCHRRDALYALLKDDKTYSFTEVDGILKKFEMGGN